jgi:hypothetical protein
MSFHDRWRLILLNRYLLKRYIMTLTLIAQYVKLLCLLVRVNDRRYAYGALGMFPPLITSNTLPHTQSIDSKQAYPYPLYTCLGHTPSAKANSGGAVANATLAAVFNPNAYLPTLSG